MKRKRNINIVISLIPAVVIYFIFVVYPTIKVFMTSMYKWSGLAPKKTFIGLDNFKCLLEDGKFWQAMKNTVFILIVCTLITMILALFLATILTQFKLREGGIYRIILFFPNVLSVVVIGSLFKNLYEPTTGILNALLRSIGLEKWAYAWLGESKTAIGAVMIVMIWQAVGYYMIIYMSGMQGVPGELYEASLIDGASKIKQFFYITMPMIWRIMRGSIVCFITSVLNMSFLFVNVMTNGGPNGSTEVLLSYMYKQAFTQANFGYAMSIAVVIFILAILLALISTILTYRKDRDLE